MARPADARAIRHHARAWHGAARQLRPQSRETGRDIPMRGLRSAAVSLRRQIRQRDRLAELFRPPAGRSGDDGRQSLRNDANRGSLQPLRLSSRPCVPRRSAADRAAVLHQWRRPEFHAGMIDFLNTPLGKCRGINAATAWCDKIFFGAGIDPRRLSVATKAG